MNISTTTLTMTTATTTASLRGSITTTTLGDVFTELSSLEDLQSSGMSLNDGSLNVSPVTLSSDWSRVVRLLMLASLAVIGSVGNVFMISAIMVEDHLKKRGPFQLSITNFTSYFTKFSAAILEDY